MTYGLIKHL